MILLILDLSLEYLLNPKILDFFFFFFIFLFCIISVYELLFLGICLQVVNVL